MFLGADDALVDDDALKRLFERIGEARYDLVTSCGVIRDDEWRPVRRFGTAWSFSRFPRNFNLCHPSVLHARTLFDKHGRFDDSYRIAGDLDFLLRLPEHIKTLHVEMETVDVGSAGISRRAFWQRIGERRRAHAQCPRIGPARAWVYWLDKVWRHPIAALFSIPH